MPAGAASATHRSRQLEWRFAMELDFVNILGLVLAGVILFFLFTWFN
ncbi:MAG: hypothetical protein ACKVS9_11695 [Phycisphaerae bacterium]